MEDQKILSDDLSSDQSSETLVKEEELEKYKKEAEENLAGWKRAMADYQNLKKETERERIGAIKLGAQSIVAATLPALDHFNDAIKHIPEDEMKKSWVSGILLIKKELEEVFKQMGIEKMETVGRAFDPSLHEAVGEDDGGESGTVIREMQAGYKFQNEILRPAKVIIAK